MWGSSSGFIGGSASFVGNRLGNFAAQDTARLDLPSYAKVDLRAGVKYAEWGVDVFVNNLTNRRALLNGGSGFNTFQATIP